MVKIYQYPSCPYCARVLNFLKEVELQPGIDYLLVEASRGTAGREEVIALGGISQVPFLTDEKLKMYESSDIIQYLKRKFKDKIKFKDTSSNSNYVI